MEVIELDVEYIEVASAEELQAWLDSTPVTRWSGTPLPHTAHIDAWHREQHRLHLEWLDTEPVDVCWDTAAVGPQLPDGLDDDIPF